MIYATKPNEQIVTLQAKQRTSFGFETRPRLDICPEYCTLIKPRKFWAYVHIDTFVYICTRDVKYQESEF